MCWETLSPFICSLAGNLAYENGREKESDILFYSEAKHKLACFRLAMIIKFELLMHLFSIWFDHCFCQSMKT
jgi:hypothetical protein